MTELYYGQASYGSRSLSVEGVAVQLAAQMIKDKARKHAAHLFQCDEEAVVYGEGKVYASFAPDQAVMTLQQVAFTLWLAWDLAPETMQKRTEHWASFGLRDARMLARGDLGLLMPEDVARAVVHAVTQPRHVLVDTIELQPSFPRRADGGAE